ncbi:MAG: SDR family oxidoreductase [Parasporobacterium sp.]|nr:SDR family oxidoreductase [Parasporobacterium sp.]
MKKVLVTGASSDVGGALIRLIQKEGCEITGTFRRETEKLKALKEDVPELKLVSCDFSDREATEAFCESIGDFDVFIHLPAPKANPLQFRKLKWEAFEEQMTVDFRSAVMISRALLPAMAKQKDGQLIFMLSSYVEEEIPPKFLTPYISAKYALKGFMKALAAEYADKGIKINGLAPSMIDTEYISELPELAREPELLTAEEVAMCILNMLKDENLKTGTSVVLNGKG